MNKKLIAFALAALPVAAMADVTLYGTLNMGVEAGSNDHYSANSGVRDYTSFIGFKGQEDLGNGLKTIWQIESQLDATGSPHANANDGVGKLASRQTFLGLDGGNLGMVRMGNLNSSIKDNFQVDQWHYAGGMASVANANQNHGVNGLSIMTNPSQRLKNAVRYDTADFDGFTGNIMYGFGENRDKSAFQGRANDIVALGLNYASPYGVAVHYAYQHEANPTNGTNPAVGAIASDSKAAYIHYLEADYNANKLFVGLAYTQMKGYAWTDGFSGDSSARVLADNSSIGASGTTPSQAGLKAQQAALSVAYTIDAFTPKVTYAKGWNLKANGSTIHDSGYQQWIVGVDYALSKRTTAELAYGSLKADKASGLGAVADGNAVSNRYSTLALSMMHSF